MQTILDIILYIWQLPQNLVGLFLKFFYPQSSKETISGIKVNICPKFPGGISLGETIIVSKKDEKMIKHEYGHQIQSLYLGPLYLIVIGLPSLIWAGIYGTKICPRSYNGYYKFYTEKSANKLGGVIRGR